MRAFVRDIQARSDGRQPNATGSRTRRTSIEIEQGKQSVVLTSNKPFGEWAQVFAGDGVMASAALDRLLHRATVINIRGDSYRLKDCRCAKGAAGDDPKPENEATK